MVTKNNKTKLGIKIPLERTLVLLKPDTLNRGLTGEIISRFERVGAKMVGLKMLVSKKDTAEKHYRQDIAERYGKEVRDLMIKMLISSPVVAIVLEGIDIIEVVRKMVGSTYPNVAPAGTIRGDYSHVSKDYANGRRIGVFNLVHASGNKEEAKIEIDIWFKPEELANHRPTYTHFTLREED